MTTFQPTMLGTIVYFEDEDDAGMITDENDDDIYIEHPFFTGWMAKTTYWELLGIEE
jgi:hypothetical protein